MDKMELQKEKHHLEVILKMIENELNDVIAESEEHAEAIREIQEERLENQVDIGGMYSAQGFEDLLQLSQDTELLMRATAAQENTERTLRKLVQMKDTPYFARIDFCFEDGEAEAIYIGRSTLMEKTTKDIHVYDWRVPIASVFYRYGVGPAEYEAPMGTIKGEVRLKRQFEIKKGELRYFFDADEQILDHFLREMLSQPAAPAMRSIVETIQRDQDRIIRDMTADLLMVQGSAGSGKTSVALHRIAYLMYQGLQKGRLSPNDILILAPNAAFEQYISRVLPELGERQVQTMLPEHMLSEILPECPIESRSAWVERYLTQPSTARKESMRQSRSVKGSKEYILFLERFIQELPEKWIPFRQVRYNGQIIRTAEQMQREIRESSKRAPLGMRLQYLEKAMWEEIRALRPERMKRLIRYAQRHVHYTVEIQPFARMLSIRESGQLADRISAFVRVDCQKQYASLMADEAAFHRLAGDLFKDVDLEAMRQATLADLQKGQVPYEDAVAIAYLEARVNGCRAYVHMRQVVVDEAQDLDAMHMALMGILFPNARFTILGDIHQTLVGRAEGALYEDFQQMLKKKNSLLVRMTKSFRCTREIWAFSQRFLPPEAAGECFSRNGEEPTVHWAESPHAMREMVEAHIQECEEAGCQSIALITKTQRDARALYEQLRHIEGISMPGSEERRGGHRVSVLSLYMAKGLEFDAVFLWDVDAEHYGEEADRNLLYIGCTRALHRLRLFYTGNRSPLLAEEREASV